MLLEAQSIKIYVKDRLLIDAPRLVIGASERIGIIGRNGSGKTTLMEVLAGMRKADVGMVKTHARRELIPQLKHADSVKSGGELTQEAIREALLIDPQILFADEPTTNLDTAHIEWVEKKLRDWQGTVVLISHDRAFLDSLCTMIWEVADGKVNIYKGHYSDYAKQKELERRQHERSYENYLREKRQLEEAIRAKEAKAARATKKPKQVSPSEAKITGAKPYFAKKQKKLQKAAKSMETRLEKLEKVEKPWEHSPIQMDVPHQDTFTGRIVMRVNDLPGRIGNRVLWRPVSFTVRGGDKLAIIGPNGCGKTTLVKMILQAGMGKIQNAAVQDASRVTFRGDVRGDAQGANRLDVEAARHKVAWQGGGEGGESKVMPVAKQDAVWIAPSVKFGYFSQNLNILDLEESILDNVRSTSSQDETLIRTVLARLHFFREDVYKKVGVLSGGERVKVALAKLFVSDMNTLVLDEPTNFLDIEAVEALESLLQDYGGTVLFVSHDRRFIANLARRLLIFEEGRIRLFEGTYDELQSYVPPEDRNAGKEEERLLLETKISDVLSRLSIEPSEELEQEFQRLIAERRRLEQQ